MITLSFPKQSSSLKFQCYFFALSLSLSVLIFPRSLQVFTRHDETMSESVSQSVIQGKGYLQRCFKSKKKTVYSRALKACYYYSIIISILQKIGNMQNISSKLEFFFQSDIVIHRVSSLLKCQIDEQVLPWEKGRVKFLPFRKLSKIGQD